MVKAYETSERIMFEEEQGFPGWLAWIMLSPILLMIGITAFMANSEDFDKREMLVGTGIMVLIQTVLFFIFKQTRLENLVSTNGLYYRWKPLQGKYRVIEKQEIMEVEIRKSPTLKYGSNRVPGYGRMHTASRGDGIQIILSSGKKVFFSSKDALAFKKALSELVQSNRKIHWRES